MSGQCDRPHVQIEHFEDLTCSSGSSSPCHWSEDLGEIDTNGGAAAAISSETRRLMSDSNSSYTPPPPLLQLQEDTIMAIDLSLPNSLLFTNDDRITSLERSVCSNFLCCGENLADFHALVDHFEENHVSAVSSSGKKLYPKQKPKIEINTSMMPSSASRSSSLSMSPAPSPTTTLDSMASTPASSRSSSVVPSPPMPVTPLSPSRDSPFAGVKGDGVTIVSHGSSPPPIAPHLPPSQSSLILPAIEYNPYIGIIAPIQLESATEVESSIASKARSNHKRSDKAHTPPFSVEVISAFGPEYDFARDYARYEEAWRRKTQEAEAVEASAAAAALAFDQAQLERELREAEEEEMERMGFSLSIHDGEDVQGLGLEGMHVDTTISTTPNGPRSSHASYSPSASYPTASSSSSTRSSSQPPATNNGGKVPKTARPRPRVNTFLPSTSSCPTSSSSAPSSSSSTPSGRPKVTIPTIPNAPPVSLGKKREKAYKCPNWGCMKAYLNPNGLKYHLEKGTCKFDDSALRGGFLRSTTSSTATSTPTSNPPAMISPTPVVATTTPPTVLTAPQDQVMEVEEDEEEERAFHSAVTRPPLQAVSSNGSCYAAMESVASKPWMAPCAV